MGPGVVPSVEVPLVASGQFRVADPLAATVTALIADGSDSPYAVAAVIS